jgi:hypothetical protein
VSEFVTVLVYDIRQVNVDKVQGENSHILIRIIPDMFILISLSDFKTMLSEDTKRYRKNSGAVWGFYITLNTNTMMAKIVSSADSTRSYPASILAIDQILDELNSI